MNRKLLKTSALVAATLALTGSQGFAQVTIPEAYAVTTYSGTKGSMMVGAHQMPSGTTRSGASDNNMYMVEAELQNGILDPVTGQPVGSDVPTDLTQLDGVINFTGNLDAGYFNAASADPAAAIADGAMPGGIVGNEYALQFEGYMQLAQGTYTMFVNSDDGFKLSVGPNAQDVLGTVLGIYDGGRGATLDGDPASFTFTVTKEGVYPFRLVYGQGTGDANIEWYMLNSASNRVLINDLTQASAVKTYPTGRGRAYIKQFLPYPGNVEVPKRPKLSFQVVDDLTTVDPGTIKVLLDGAELAGVSKNKVGSTTTVTWASAVDYPLGSQHTGEFIYTESSGISRTNAISFSIVSMGPSDFPASSFWIEIEDFDFNKGQHLAVADDAYGTNPNPYPGGAYVEPDVTPDTGAVLDIDYHKGIGPLNGAALGGYTYRTDIPGWLDPGTDTKPGYFVTLGSKMDAGIADTRPGGFTVTANYNTTWSGSSWYNLTRTIPSGIYNVYLAACHWNNTDAPTPGQIDSSLSKVTAGVGTKTQTLQPLGTFYGPAIVTGTAENYTILKGSDGTPAVVKGGKSTFRFAVNAGDSDYLLFAPITGVPARATVTEPANNSVAKRNAPINVTIEDFSTSVVLNSVKLILDGQDVTAQAKPTKPADVTTLVYTPASVWDIGSSHTYVVQFTDSASAKFAFTNTFQVMPLGSPGQFVIEAEDFNYGGGQFKEAANTMPYLGSAYEGMDSVLNVDYLSRNADQTAGGFTPVYRGIGGELFKDGQQVCLGNMDGVQDDRGSWTLQANYKIGWAGNAAWQNFTRTFPAGTYTVYAALATGNDTDENGTFDLVTSGSTTTNQTLLPLGAFDAPTTGGWGNYVLVPMKDPSGALATVNLSGTQTVRWNSVGGDEDYFLFVPGATPVAASIVTGPQGLNVMPGDAAQLSVIASGTGPLTYQWKFKGTAMPGETNATLKIASTAVESAGAYNVTVTGATGPAVTSAEATLTVGAAQEVRFTSVKRNADKSVTLEWTGTGVLQVATSLSPANWSDAPGGPAPASPYTFTPDPATRALFARIIVK